MNKDKIRILDIKTAEQMFHYLNNLPFYYDVSKEELEKVDKNILFSFLKYIKDKDFYKLKNLFYKQIETIEKLKEAIENLYEIKEPKITYLDD